MTPDFLRGFLQAGIFVTLVSLGLVFTTQQDSAEFVISVCSLGIGVLLVGMLILMMRLGQR
jgi:hypothetical protein